MNTTRLNIHQCTQQNTFLIKLWLECLVAKDLKQPYRKRKSKCDYKISIAPTSEQIEAIEATVNEIINQHLSVTSFFVTRDNVPSDVDLSKLPDDASETLRIVKIGDYDICACIGAHVNNTSEIGKFTIISTDYTEGRFRIRFKLANS